MSLTCRFPGGQPARIPCCSRLPSPDDGDYDDDDDVVAIVADDNDAYDDHDHN